MTDPHTGDIPEAIHDAAGDWLNQLEAGADPETARAFRKWKQADPRHAIAFEQIKKDWQLGKLLDQRAIGRNRALPRAPFWMRHRTHVAAATFGIAALLGVVTVGLVRPGGPFAITSQAQAAVYETKLGEIRTVPLPDGSSVVLDTASRMTVAFTPDGRRLDLEKGRARFDVVSEQRRPFRVVIPGGEVIARGTIFDVSLIDAAPLVTALEGEVELREESGKGDEPLQLHAGKSLILGQAVAQKASSTDVRWVSGMLSVDGTALSDAIAAINRYNRVQLRLGDPALAPLVVTGAFRVRDPSGFADAIAKSFRLTAKHAGESIILMKALDGAQK